MTTANRKSARDIAVTVLSAAVIAAVGVYSVQQVQGSRIANIESALADNKATASSRSDAIDLKVNKLVEDVGWIRGYLEKH